MRQLAFLHTSPVHVATFDRLLAELAPGTPARHLVDESLLEEARAGGVTPALVGRVHEGLRAAAADGAALVLCTCSTIGGIAEEGGAGIPVLRVDRAMAARAVALAAGRILVVAALESTLAPTADLLAEEAGRAGRAPEVSLMLCPGAWAAFEAGDLEGYYEQIGGLVRAAARPGDVVVLAQASMAGAAGRCAGLGAEILSSPRLGLTAALELLRA